jgi:STAM-binding protein
VYAAEGNDPQTYLLLYRHANLVLEHLTNHPERNQPENRKALGAATAAVGSDIQTLEDIRPRIKKRHEEFQARRKAQQKALQSLEGKSVRLIPHELDGTPRGRGYEKQTLDAEGNQSLATKLAQREVKRRDAARRSIRQAGVSEEEESERRTGGMWGDWEKELKHQSAEADDDLSAQLQEVARMQQTVYQPPAHSVSVSLPVRLQN